MNKLIAVLLTTVAVIFTTNAWSATAPSVTITARTTNTVSVSFDTTGMGKQDSLIVLFAVEAADSLDGTELARVATANADTVATLVLTGLPENTWGYIIARVDSAGAKAYTARDSVRTLLPQIVDTQRPNFDAPIGTNLIDANSMPGVASPTSTWTIKAAGVDSTGIYYSAPFQTLLISYVGTTDSTNVKIIGMAGYTNEANLVGTTTTANWYAQNSFIFTPVDTITVSTAGTNVLFFPFDYSSFSNAIQEMHYYKFLGVVGNDNSTGTVFSAIREIRGN